MGCELLLLVPAVAWRWVFHDTLLPNFDISLAGVLLGLSTALPLIALFAWSLKSQLTILARHRGVVEVVVTKLFGGWSLWQLAVVAAAAGLCEEALFRGAIQTTLTGLISPAPAVLAVALLFGALHLITWTYGVLAALMGLYLGGLFLLTGNLLVPVLTHALYDFLALVYFFKFHVRE